MKLCFDLETDGLDYSLIWLVVAQDVDSGETFVFSDHDSSTQPLKDFMPLFDRATALIGHNIISFDLPALKKITGWTPSNQKIVDTLLVSQLAKFPRFPTRSHSMKTWGDNIGQAKHDNPDWDVYSDEMRDRCITDVELNVLIFNKLMHEHKFIVNNSPYNYKDAVKLEHETALECAKMTENGWKLDIRNAHLLVEKLDDRMIEIQDEIEPRLPMKRTWIDKVPRQPKWLKDGRVDRITADWLGVDRNVDPKLVPEEYQRYRDDKADLGNTAQVTELLLSLGWQPTEWNWTFINGEFIKKSPKLTEDSLSTIEDGLGQLVAEWRMLRARKGLVSGLIRDVRSDGRISCDPSVIGTHTSRMRHRGIVNIPGAFAPYGKEIRSLFIAEEGYSLVGCDSAANQLRGLAHYLQDEEFTHSAVHGSQENGDDIHTRNANILGISRNDVKPFFYALIFGAGVRKLGQTVGAGQKEGKELRARFMEGMPSYDTFVRQLDMQWEMNGGFVWGLDGRPVFCDKRHKALNNLLQAFEAVTVKSAMVLVMEEIKKRGIDAKLVIIYHDEIELEVKSEQAEEVAEICKWAFAEAPKKYGVDIMTGDPKIGQNWYEIH